MKRESDFLDYVLDNEATGKREIYRDGRIIAVCGKTALSAGSLKHFDAEGPWGTFPPHARAVRANEADARAASHGRIKSLVAA